MDKPNILSIARQQLSDAISSLQAPTCDPLKVSPWIAMSRNFPNARDIGAPTQENMLC